MVKATVKKRKKNRFFIPPAMVKDVDPRTAGHVAEAMKQTNANMALAVLALLGKVTNGRTR